jgi:hypothetical protein
MNNVFDLHHQVEQRTALAIAAITTNTTTAGIIIDTANYTALEFLLIAGTVTDGAYAVSLEHGDDSGLSDAAAVPAAETLGDADIAAADDDASKRIGYIGKKRYVRLSIVSTGVTTGVDGVGAIAVLGGASHQPVAD